ncbi:MAG TPA: TatD family hydrolase [Thermoanaerobaculia bacterium]|nr:TatD family hydrolase [Thermoanaerobaculia bacterium]
MGLIDSHCHIQALPPEERERALDLAREAGVTGFLVPATRLDETETVLELCQRHQDVWCALGVHPHEASSWREQDLELLRSLAREPGVVAIGECGLDYHYDHSPRSIQRRVVRAQWELAIEVDLPVIVHNRDSDDDMISLLKEPRFRTLRADFHSFAGSAELLEVLLAREVYLGVTGMVTFKNADNIRRQLSLIPLDRLLLETDTPFLAPVPHRGRPNQPAWVVEVARVAADTLGIPVSLLAERSSGNFSRLFAVSAP